MLKLLSSTQEGHIAILVRQFAGSMLLRKRKAASAVAVYQKQVRDTCSRVLSMSGLLD